MKLYISFLLRQEATDCKSAAAGEIISKIESIENKLTKLTLLQTEQEKDIKNILFSLYIDLINDAPSKKMGIVAPIIRRQADIVATNKYPELGIRCFGKGTFHKPALNGIEVGTKKLYQIKERNLLFSNVFAWKGAIAVAQAEDNNRFGSHRFISCDCDLTQVLPEFLNFHFLTPKGLEEINRCSPGGAGRNKTLGLKKIEAIEVSVPDLEKQFIKTLEKFKQLNKYREEQQEELKQLIPSLLNKAFKGEL